MSDKGILVTGGTGTFGRAFVPVLMDKSDIGRIVVLSRDELKQAEMERDLRGLDGFHKLRFYLGDVRDVTRLEMAMHSITHVVHAAALKRVEKCENDPIEAVRTNIEGTANVIHAALRRGVFNVVGLSTDKACNPINLYGATKLAMERLLIAANNLAGGMTRFSVVRYGNIFGSRGSVVRTWQEIRAGEFAVVSDPDATRFMMRPEEAVNLVMRQLFTVDPVVFRFPGTMPAYRLGDLAEAMGLKATRTVGLGLREKLHEELGDGQTSDKAPRLTVAQLREELARI